MFKLKMNINILLYFIFLKKFILFFFINKFKFKILFIPSITYPTNMFCQTIFYLINEFLYIFSFNSINFINIRSWWLFNILFYYKKTHIINITEVTSKMKSDHISILQNSGLNLQTLFISKIIKTNI